MRTLLLSITVLTLSCISVVIIISLFGCASDSYRLPDVPKGVLRPEFTQQDVALQEELVEGWRIRCNKSGRNEIICNKYEDEHGYLQNFYYDPIPEKNEKTNDILIPAL